MKSLGHSCFPPNFGSFGKAVLEKKIFRNLEINHSETRIACVGHVLLIDQNEMSNLYRGPFIDASYQVSVVAMFVICITGQVGKSDHMFYLFSLI
jgi:hypothetical protein